MPVDDERYYLILGFLSLILTEVTSGWVSGYWIVLTVIFLLASFRAVTQGRGNVRH